MDNNFSANEINKVIKNKDAASILSSLSDDDKKLFDSLLKDEKARNEFLSSKEAKAVLSALFKSR